MMDAVQAFTDAVSPFLPTWTTVEIRAIVDFETQSILSMLAYFSPVDRQELDIAEPVRGLSFVRAALPREHAEAMLRHWQQGHIRLDARDFSVANFPSAQFFDHFPPVEEAIYRDLRFGIHRQFVLSFHGTQQVDTILSSKNPHALAAALGFPSFEELSLQRVQFRAGSGYSMRVALFAPILAMITAEAADARLHLAVTVHEATPLSDLRLWHRLVDERGERLRQDDIALAGFDRSRDRYMAVLTSTLPLPDGTRSGEFRLYHRGYKAQTEPLVLTGFVIGSPATDQATGAGSFGERLRRLREELVIGQAELAREAGLAQSDVWMIEHDRRRPRPAMVRRLAEALSRLGGRHVHPSELAGPTAPPAG